MKTIFTDIKCSFLEFIKNISIPFQKYFIEVDVIKVSLPFFGIFYSDLSTLLILLIYMFMLDFVTGILKSYFYARKNNIAVRKYITSRRMFSIFYQLFVVISIINAFYIIDFYAFERVLITKYVILMSIIQLLYSVLENISDIAININGNTNKNNIFVIIKYMLDMLKNTLKNKNKT